MERFFTRATTITICPNSVVSSDGVLSIGRWMMDDSSPTQFNKSWTVSDCCDNATVGKVGIKEPRKKIGQRCQSANRRNDDQH